MQLIDLKDMGENNKVGNSLSNSADTSGSNKINTSQSIDQSMLDIA